MLGFFLLLLDGFYGLFHISFAEENTADQVIYERANYAAQTGQRIIAVTDDRALQDDLKALGVKVLFCRKFYHSFKPSEK